MLETKIDRKIITLGIISSAVICLFITSFFYQNLLTILEPNLRLYPGPERVGHFYVFSTAVVIFLALWIVVSVVATLIMSGFQKQKVKPAGNVFSLTVFAFLITLLISTVLFCLLILYGAVFVKPHLL